MVIPGYRIERQLGRGGMATVYITVQESLNRHVALKVIKPELASAGALTPALEQQLSASANTRQDATNSRLTVTTQSQNARLRTLNIKPRYHDGISLSPGRYHIKVNHSGYRSQNRWITIADQDVDLAITLNHAPAVSDSRQSSRRKSRNVSKPRREKKGGIKGFFERMDRKIQDMVH